MEQIHFSRGDQSINDIAKRAHEPERVEQSERGAGRRRSRYAFWLAGPCLGVMALACDGPAQNYSAEKTGDLTYALQERIAPDTQQLQQCGNGSAMQEATTPLKRRPYLQQVSDSAADVVFTAAGLNDVKIDITRPNGELVQSVDATVDETANPVGANQLMARVDGLNNDELYCYTLRDLTTPAGFYTAPKRGSDKPVSFIAFGDSGSGGIGQEDLMQQMFTVPFQLVVHTGDIAYSDGKLGQLESKYFNIYEPVSRSFAVFPVSGNHDYRTADADPILQSFVLPENGGDAGRERYFSFDWGDVHFVALDTELIGKTQADWLDADLTKNDLPWTVVYGHRPAYSSGAHGSNPKFQSYFVPIIEKHKVNLVLAGHDHHYERTYPINGVTYVVTGGGGRGVRSVGSHQWTAFADSVIHFVYVDVHDGVMDLHAIDAVGREFDSARIH